MKAVVNVSLILSCIPGLRRSLIGSRLCVLCDWLRRPHAPWRYASPLFHLLGPGQMFRRVPLSVPLCCVVLCPLSCLPLLMFKRLPISDWSATFWRPFKKSPIGAYTSVRHLYIGNFHQCPPDCGFPINSCSPKTVLVRASNPSM